MRTQQLQKTSNATWWQRWFSNNVCNPASTPRTIQFPEARRMAEMDQALWTIPTCISAFYRKSGETSQHVSLLPRTSCRGYTIVDEPFGGRPGNLRGSQSQVRRILPSPKKDYHRASTFQPQSSTKRRASGTIHSVLTQPCRELCVRRLERGNSQR